VIHQNLPDHLRAQGKEMCAILAADAPSMDQLEVSLVGQSAGGYDLPGGLASQLPPGNPAEIRVHQRHQLI
jgi:hypothetical protein